MKPLRLSIKRLLRVAIVFGKYRLDRLIPLGPDLSLLLKMALLPLRVRTAPHPNVGVDLKLALIELGPAFIKLGQLLSTRRDLLPNDIADELETLQDQVPAFESEVAVALIETSLERPLAGIFKHFDPKPLASASIAQVHTAELDSGESVVIKIRRPDITERVLEDLQILESLAALTDQRWTQAQRLHLPRVIKDYQNVILAELDFEQEAQNTIKLRALWLDRGKLYVPKIYPDLTRENLLVMERVEGTVVSHKDQLIDQGVNLERLANLGVEIFFTQVFEDNFFHADMHPGNILVDTSNPSEPTYIALDCAIIGSLTRADRNYLARNITAFFNEDYLDIAEAHVDSGWVPAHVDVTEFERVIRQVCAPLFGKKMAEIEFGKLLISLFSAAADFEMEVQPQLILLQKTLLNIEGIGRHLYGELDLWTTAAPFMLDWQRQKKTLPHLLKEIQRIGPELLQELPDLPRNLLLASRRIERLSEAMRRQNQQIQRLELKRSIQHEDRSRAILFLSAAGACATALLTLESPGMTLLWPLVIGLGLTGAYYLIKS
ncbi:MAG: AarF/UbiB family protein [Pseudomonadales bacterium]|nr:AarF/UbiB family protein [Pseudomonadales bacterium]